MSVALHADSFGDATEHIPLVILHGLFGSSTNWRAVAKRLSKHRRVHALDLRNHGESAHDDAMSYVDMATDVRAWLSDNEVNDAVIMGHSMGGKVAMTLALEGCNALHSLIVVDIAPVARGGDIEPLLAAMRALPVSTLERRSELDAALGEHVPEPGLRAFLLQNLRRRGDAFEWRLNLHAIERNLPAILGFGETLDSHPYEGRCLFVRGALSNYVLPAHEPLIKQLFPRVTFETIEAAGHWLHAEQPGAFIDCVQRFLDGEGAVSK